MRLFALSAVALCVAFPAQAHHPERECQPVTRRIDVIGPLGNCLPPGYRRRYNRPTNIGGKIAYFLAPSSQEAMAWHAAQHRCEYESGVLGSNVLGPKAPRHEAQYFYPKPYEALRIGPRPKPESEKPKPKAAEDREVTFDGPDVDPLDPGVKVDESVNRLLDDSVDDSLDADADPLEIRPEVLEETRDMLESGFEPRQ